MPVRCFPPSFGLVQKSAKPCKTNLLVRCFPQPQFGHSTEKPAPWAHSSHSPSTAPKELPQCKCNARVNSPYQDRCQKHWQTAAHNSEISMPQCRHSSEDVEYFHGVSRCSAPISEPQVFCLNPTSDMNHNPLKTISISKKPSRIRIVRSKRE